MLELDWKERDLKDSRMIGNPPEREPEKVSDPFYFHVKAKGEAARLRLRKMVTLVWQRRPF